MMGHKIHFYGEIWLTIPATPNSWSTGSVASELLACVPKTGFQSNSVKCGV